MEDKSKKINDFKNNPDIFLENKFNLLIESNILSISTNYSSKILILEILSPWNKKKHLITIDGVDELKISGMRMNNIIEEMVCYSGVIDENLMSLLKDLYIDETSTYEFLKIPELDKKIENIKNGQLKLWELSSICGASLLVLGKNISLSLVNE